MSKEELAFRKLYEQLVEVDAEARSLWDERDRLILELVKMLNMGRKSEIVVKLSDRVGLQITDNRKKFCQDGKLFAPAFARRWDWKEVKL